MRIPGSGVISAGWISPADFRCKSGTAILSRMQPWRPGSVKTILMKCGRSFLYISLGFFIALSWVYFAGLDVRRGAQLALGLYVADSRGDRVTFARASGWLLGGRFLAHVPPFGLYYFWLIASVPGDPTETGV